MERFKKIPPIDMSEWFVQEDEQLTFSAGDWNLPIPWIAMFVYTHIKAKFYGYRDGDENEYEQPRVLQIGCAQGGDAVDIAKILKLPMINGRLDVIDWFKGNLTVDYDEEWAYNEDNAPIWRNHLETEAKKFKVNDIITIHEGDSREVIHKMKNNYYDIVFIDGGHEYDIVKSDIENGYKKLKDGGIIVMDDFSGGRDAYKKYDIKNATKEMLKKDTYKFGETSIHVGVIKAVHEFFNGNYIVCETHDKVYNIKGYKIERV